MKLLYGWFSEQHSKVTGIFVYLCTGKTVSIKGIGAGDYRLYFCTGTYWDKARKAFKQLG